MPYIGELTALGLAKETVPGTKTVPPTEFLAAILPESLAPTIELLASTGVRGNIQDPIKMYQGAGEVKDMKFNLIAEPENIGNLLMGLFGTDTKTGPTDTTAYTHTFTRVASVTLPRYTFWVDKQTHYPIFVGTMVKNIKMKIKAKEPVTFEVTLTSTSYDTDVTRTVSYSSLRPFEWFMGALKVAGGAVTDYDNVEIEFENNVQAIHTVTSTIWPKKIYSGPFSVKGSLDFVIENKTEYDKFLAGTDTSMQLTLTSTELAGAASVYHSLDITIPHIKYATAPLHNQKGLLRVPFGFQGWRSGATELATVTLINTVAAAY